MFLDKGKYSMSKKIKETLMAAAFYYWGIPFLVSLLSMICYIGLADRVPIEVLVVIFTGFMYWVLRKRIKGEEALHISGVVLVVLLVIFTIALCVSSGSLNHMAWILWLIIPCLPLFLSIIFGMSIHFCIAIFLVYLTSCICAFVLSERKPNVKIWGSYLVSVCLCVGICTPVYRNRPEARYAGHGFEFMHGYSSTDFKDYMVYSKNSKLVTLDHEASFRIENEEDMPVMDGAEACYPLYAAVAKAVYKGIDVIEEEFAKENNDDYKRYNGKIVTFTNTVRGIERFMPTSYTKPIDIFFGAYPSKGQLEMLEKEGIYVDATQIGREAFVFFVEDDNPVTNLTSEQVKAIYHGDITNWKDVGGNDQEIIAFQRPQNSGSQTMMEYFMGDISLQEPKTYEVIDAMTGVIDKVAQYANDDGALGYSFRYFIEGLNQEKHVHLLSIDGIAPTQESIEDGSYPLTVGLYAITRRNGSKNANKLVEYMLSEEGQQFVHDTGYGRIQY